METGKKSENKQNFECSQAAKRVSHLVCDVQNFSQLVVICPLRATNYLPALTLKVQSYFCSSNVPKAWSTCPLIFLRTQMQLSVNIHVRAVLSDGVIVWGVFQRYDQQSVYAVVPLTLNGDGWVERSEK